MNDETTTPLRPGEQIIHTIPVTEATQPDHFQQLSQRGYSDTALADRGRRLSRGLKKLRNHPEQVSNLIGEDGVSIDGLPVEEHPGPISSTVRAMLMRSMSEELAIIEEQAIARLAGQSSPSEEEASEELTILKDRESVLSS